MPMNMTEIVRSRDLVLFFKGDAYPATPGPNMMASGWKGGQGVTWVAGKNDEITVEISDGRYGAIALYGSDEVADRYTGLSGGQAAARYLTVILGGNLITTSTYERYTLASRIGPGPLVPLVYVPNQILYLSLRGYWTSEDEAALSGKPWGSNFFTGFVSQVPKASNDYYLGVQTSM